MIVHTCLERDLRLCKAPPELLYAYLLLAPERDIHRGVHNTSAEEARAGWG